MTDCDLVYTALTHPHTVSALRFFTGLPAERVQRALNRLRAQRAVELLDDDRRLYCRATGPFRQGVAA